MRFLTFSTFAEKQRLISVNLRESIMSKAARKKTSQVIIVKNEAEFYGSIEKRLKKQGYVLLETALKACKKSKPQKELSLDL